MLCQQRAASSEHLFAKLQWPHNICCFNCNRVAIQPNTICSNRSTTADANSIPLHLVKSMRLFRRCPHNSRPSHRRSYSGTRCRSLSRPIKPGGRKKELFVTLFLSCNILTIKLYPLISLSVLNIASSLSLSIVLFSLLPNRQRHQKTQGLKLNNDASAAVITNSCHNSINNH